MNEDELLRRWEPLGPITEGPVPSYQAKGSDGQFVQVHRIATNTPTFTRLFALIQQILPHPPPDLVEIGEFDGGMAVVTHILPAQLGLENWLEDSLARLDRGSPTDLQEPEPSAPPRNQDYSAYFQIPQQDQPPVESPSPEPGDLDTPTTVPRQESYTSVFRASSGPLEPTESEAPKGPSGGEGYTSLFEASSLARAEEAATPAKRSSPPVSPPRPRETPHRSGGMGTSQSGDLEGVPKEPTRDRESSPTEADSITDMFRKPEARPTPTRGPDPRRPQRWDEPERGLPPLQIRLDEYIRRLERSS